MERNKILFSAFLLFTLTACSLDESPRDQIPEEEAYTSTTALYQNCVATLYNYIGGCRRTGTARHLPRCI